MATLEDLIKRMKYTLEIITEEGRRTFIKAESYKSSIFTGPDSANEVWFKELECDANISG